MERIAVGALERQGGQVALPGHAPLCRTAIDRRERVELAWFKVRCPAVSGLLQTLRLVVRVHERDLLPLPLPLAVAAPRAWFPKRFGGVGGQEVRLGRVPLR